MIETDKEYCLEVWGDLACFTRPELKVERVSYDVITPSAARNIFQSIFWKPAIQWVVTRIEVLNPIKHISIRRNEVGAIGSTKSNAKPIIATANRQQKNTIMLRDVRYRIYAQMVYIPPKNRKNETVHSPGKDENPMKYQQIFERRASKGQVFSMPYLGTRECSAFFELISSNIDKKGVPLAETRDFGIMLYDMDFSDSDNIMPMFYHAEMINGVIEVPEPDSNEVMR